LEAVDVLRLLVVEVVLSGTTVVLAQAFMALEKPGIVTFLQGVGLAASLPLLITLIPLYGLAGAGLALVGTTLIRLIFILICYPLVLKTRPPDLLIKREDFVFLAKTLHLER
jgi:O-antigen/teichoic acid export membrane protein